MLSAVIETAVLAAVIIAAWAVYTIPLRLAGRGRTYRKAGYLDSPHARRGLVFGPTEYTVRRRLGATLFSTCHGSKNPYFYRRKSILKFRFDKQDGTPCEVCGTTCTSARRCGEGPYIREQWRAFRVFGVPIFPAYCGYEAYCERHPPRDWGDRG